MVLSFVPAAAKNYFLRVDKRQPGPHSYIQQKQRVNSASDLVSSFKTYLLRVLQPSGIRRLNYYLLRGEKLPITSNRFRSATLKKH